MSGRLKKADDWIDAHRPCALLGLVALAIGILALINWLTGSDLFRQFFYPNVCDPKTPATCDPLAWKDLMQAALLILGLPAAFLLWHWRDRNVRDQIEEQRKQVENARKDINLKEFQEVQLRAAGALDEKLPAEAREQLQIAALHQLRGFLRGEYGESFRRPAFELLLASHAAAMERIGLKEAIDRWLLSHSPPLPHRIRQTIVDAVYQARKRWTAVERERAGIIRDEWRAVFLQGFPFNGRRLDGIEVPFGASLARRQLGGIVLTGANLHGAELKGADMSRAHLEGVNLSDSGLGGANLERANLKGALLRSAQLMGANLRGAELDGANLFGAKLQGADLSEAQIEGAILNQAHLERADLRRTNLISADLSGAYLEGATLRESHLEYASLRGARLEGAILSLAQLEGADLCRSGWQKAKLPSAKFDDATILFEDWHSAHEDQRNHARDELRALGARHVDDPQAPDTQGASREDGTDEMEAAEAV